MADEMTEQNETTAASPEPATPATEKPAAAQEPGEPNKPAGSERYDFGAAQRLSEGQLRQLRQVHDRFSKDLATSLSALTRQSIKALTVSCTQMATPEADRELAKSGLLIVLDAHPMDDRFVLGMDAALVFPLLEALLGGHVAGPADFQRELTEIELSVLQDLHAVLLRELERAWRTVARFTLQVIEQQADPQSWKSGSSAEGSLLALVDLETEGNAGRITLLYPARIGREIEAADPTNDAVRRPEVLQQAVFERLKESVLTMEGRLLGASMRLKDLADLRAGDVLCLDIPLDQPIDIAVNGASRFGGRLSDAGRKRAIRVQDILPPKAEQPWSR
jgi:flagellar motor switch protein FliM